MATMNARSHPSLPGFGWVLPGELAGMAFPLPHSWYELRLEGVRAVVTLTGEPPTDPTEHGLTWLHHPIVDFGIPDPAGLERTIAWMKAEVEEGRPVVVHCHAGLGRTGTVLAAYLGRVHGVQAGAAIEKVRALRPHSIETRGQQDFVRQFLS